MREIRRDKRFVDKKKKFKINLNNYEEAEKFYCYEDLNQLEVVCPIQSNDQYFEDLKVWFF